jgi:hypothetical protein
MTTTQLPPRPPEVQDDVDAGVIEDARARERKHRRVGAVAVLAAAIAAGLLLTFGGGSGSSGGGSAGKGNGGQLGGFASHVVIPAPSVATSAQIAAANSACEYEGGYPTFVPGRVVLAQATTRYTAFISLAGGHAYDCLYGHIGKVHAVVWNDLGSIGVAPAVGKLVWFGVNGGVGSVPGQFQIPNWKSWVRTRRSVRPRRRPTAAEEQLEQRRAAGVGFGDLTFGRAGKGVTAIKLQFANGSIVDATLQHGWYFAWWHGFTNPKSIEVITKTGGKTSPMTGRRHRSPLAVPACKPGTNGCVFDE